MARNLQTLSKFDKNAQLNHAETVVGYAFVFENIVVYAKTFRETLRLLIGKKKFGAFLGAVKALVPYDEKYQKDSKKYRERKMERSILKRMGLSRRKMRNSKRLGQTELR